VVAAEQRRRRERETERKGNNQRPFSSIFMKALGLCDLYILLLRISAPLSTLPSCLYVIPRNWKEDAIDFTSSPILLLASSGKMGGVSLINQNISPMVEGIFSDADFVSWPDQVCPLQMLGRRTCRALELFLICYVPDRK
jgi:hypothetical protein